MSLQTLEHAISGVQRNQEDEEFGKLLILARDALGIKPERAARFAGMSYSRLKYLEKGDFRNMPTETELAGLSLLYNLNMFNLRIKAEETARHFMIQQQVKKHRPDEEQRQICF